MTTPPRGFCAATALAFLRHGRSWRSRATRSLRHAQALRCRRAGLNPKMHQFHELTASQNSGRLTPQKSWPKFPCIPGNFGVIYTVTYTVSHPNLQNQSRIRSLGSSLQALKIRWGHTRGSSSLPPGIKQTKAFSLHARRRSARVSMNVSMNVRGPYSTAAAGLGRGRPSWRLCPCAAAVRTADDDGGAG